LKDGLFFKRKEIWIPTWRSWFLFAGAFVAVTVFLIKATPIFLAPNAPVNARILVVEGWIDEDALEAAKALQKINRYDLVLVAGGRIEKGFFEASYGTFAELGMTRLKNMGYTATNLVAVPSSDAPKDRTYHSALSVRDYLLKTPYRSLDLLSTSVHSRRSWLMYRHALGPEFKIGIYAAPSTEFDPKHWYRKSSGVRTVMSEAISFLYARFLFRPDAFESPPELKASPTNPAPAVAIP
jgi:hypothetical protein